MLAELAGLAEELAAGRAAVTALAEIEAVAKAVAAIRQALEDKTLTLMRPTRRMLKVFRFGPLTLEVTVPQGSVVAGMEEDEMMNVIKKVTNDAELDGAVSYLLTEKGASAPPHIKMSINPSEGSPEGPPD